jgi:AcrR family transcriptional regulator
MNIPDKNDRKSRKQQRVCSYFIQAAKEIILADGVDHVSVRKVADGAGYAFSTIYKHYKDLDALLQDVKSSMIEDLVTYMSGVMPETVTSLDDIKKSNRAYAAYFLEHPHVFRFFYSYRLSLAPLPPVALPDFSRYWEMTYRSFVETGALRPEELPLLVKTTIYSLQGLLALYFSGYGMTAELLFAELDQVADYLLGGKLSV